MFHRGGVEIVWQWFWSALWSLVVVFVVLGIAAYTVLLERKVCSAMQGRIGPNRVRVPILSDIPLIGPWLTRLGFFQMWADIGKLLLKEEIVPWHVHKVLYYLAPCLMFFPAFAVLAVIPFGEFNSTAIALADVDLGAVFILAVTSMGIYSLILAGYASRSKYPALSGVRSAAQLISYEVAMVLALLSVGVWAPSFKLSDIVAAQASSVWWVIAQPLTAFIYLICMLAETNRGPFDMSEAEAELAGGYNVEYGALGFGMFFVGEYANMIVASAVFICLFLGGWTLPFVTYPAGWIGAVLSVGVFLVKLGLMLTGFVWVRWSFPRFRYDQVMKLGWTALLPLALANLVFNAAVGYLNVKGGF